MLCLSSESKFINKPTILNDFEVIQIRIFLLVWIFQRHFTTKVYYLMINFPLKTNDKWHKTCNLFLNKIGKLVYLPYVNDENIVAIFKEIINWL